MPLCVCVFVLIRPIVVLSCSIGVPNETHPILELREAVEINRTTGPLLVHCRYVSYVYM